MQVVLFALERATKSTGGCSKVQNRKKKEKVRVSHLHHSNSWVNLGRQRDVNLILVPVHAVKMGGKDALMKMVLEKHSFETVEWNVLQKDFLQLLFITVE